MNRQFNQHLIRNMAHETDSKDTPRDSSTRVVNKCEIGDAKFMAAIKEGNEAMYCRTYYPWYAPCTPHKYAVFHFDNELTLLRGDC